jgi:hypothetical protein
MEGERKHIYGAVRRCQRFDEPRGTVRSRTMVPDRRGLLPGRGRGRASVRGRSTSSPAMESRRCLARRSRMKIMPSAPASPPCTSEMRYALSRRMFTPGTASSSTSASVTGIRPEKYAYRTTRFECTVRRRSDVVTLFWYICRAYKRKIGWSGASFSTFENLKGSLPKVWRGFGTLIRKISGHSPR